MVAAECPTPHSHFYRGGRSDPHILTSIMVAAECLTRIITFFVVPAEYLTPHLTYCSCGVADPTLRFYCPHMSWWHWS